VGSVGRDRADEVGHRGELRRIQAPWCRGNLGCEHELDRVAELGVEPRAVEQMAGDEWVDRPPGGDRPRIRLAFDRAREPPSHETRFGPNAGGPLPTEQLACEPLRRETARCVVVDERVGPLEPGVGFHRNGEGQEVDLAVCEVEHLTETGHRRIVGRRAVGAIDGTREGARGGIELVELRLCSRQVLVVAEESFDLFERDREAQRAGRALPQPPQPQDVTARPQLHARSAHSRGPAAVVAHGASCGSSSNTSSIGACGFRRTRSR
jgi:hypothetical protein